MSEFGSTMRGLGASECPFKPGTPEHAAAMREWILQENADRHHDGRKREESLAMRAQADAAFVAAGYGRPDPTAEILGLPAEPTVVLKPGEVVAAFAELKKLVQVMVDGLVPIVESVVDAMSKLLPPPGVVDSVRHGSAATCPRHGPTRGGTCMRCVRSMR